MAQALLRHPLLLVAALGVVVVAFVAGGAGVFGTASLAAPEEGYEQNGWRGTLKLTGGQDGRGERFVTSWKAGEKSELIVAKARLDRVRLTYAYGLCAYQYRVFVNGAPQEHWNSPIQRFPNAVVQNFVDLQPLTFSVIGAVAGDVRVELWVDVDAVAFTDSGCRGTFKKFAQDGAALVSGRGQIRVQGGSDKFEEGDTITFGVDSGHGHWRVTLYDGVGNPRCGLRSSFTTLATADGLVSQRTGCKTSLEWDNTGRLRGDSDSRQGTISYTVPEGAFRPDGKNKWRIVLENTVIAQASDEFVTLDKKDLAPEVPQLSLSPETPTVGGVVTVQFRARANPASQSPITGFVLTAWYGSANLPPAAGDSSYIVDSINVPARLEGDRYVATYEFRVGEPSVIRYRGYAVDAAGRMSGSQLNQADVRALEKRGMEEPNANARGEIHPQGSEGQTTGYQAPEDSRGDPGRLLLLAVVVGVAVVLTWLYLPGGVESRIAVISVEFLVGMLALELGWFG